METKLMKRITMITGHYGSGKTEVSVNLACDLRKEYEKVAILDLDIMNPYFRSRERQKMMEDLGIMVQFNSFGYDITEDLPALSAALKTPLENKDYMAIVDVGGDNDGARVLNQFHKYLIGDDAELLFVVNTNRPETEELDGCLWHIAAIQAETGLKIKGLINNTHLLSETTPADIHEGYQMCKDIEKETGIPIAFSTCREDLVDDLKAANEQAGIDDMEIYPIKLYMRPSWLL
jgi:energy-coupling factor transporter ATP-binding protein EcfA2